MKPFIRLTAGLLLIATPVAAFAADMAMGKKSGPIEINSDSLEVLQQESRAIFTGNVVAIQGSMRLKSDKMTVFYRKAEDKKPDAKEGDNNAIDKIEVQGNVFLSSPEETASGASGTYDVVRDEVVLINNVVVTRGQNVLKGDRLTYNLTSGKSVISSAGATTSDTGKKQRVRALFVPGSEEKK